MKYLIPVLAIIVLSIVVTDAGLDQRKKREVTASGVFGAIGCLPTVMSAVGTCNDVLNERMKEFNNENIGNPGRCCWFAAFRKCVSDLAYEKCGRDATEVVDSVISSTQSTLQGECKDYQLYNPVCVYFVYFPYVVIGAVVSALILIGCCLGACCCR